MDIERRKFFTQKVTFDLVPLWLNQVLLSTTEPLSMHLSFHHSHVLFYFSLFCFSFNLQYSSFISSFTFSAFLSLSFVFSFTAFLSIFQTHFLELFPIFSFFYVKFIFLSPSLFSFFFVLSLSFLCLSNSLSISFQSVGN